MSTDWFEVSVVTDGEAAEAVAEALRPFAYQESVVLEQLGDPHNLDPEALEANVTVKIYVAKADATPALQQRLKEILYHLNRLYPIPPPTFRMLAEQDWANSWKVHYRPFRVGDRIWIRPSWIGAEQADAISPKPNEIVLTLDPGMAFGTGLHPTTQTCLHALEMLVQPGMRVLDVGTGSGILAIAAAKLGATAVTAVDTDVVAVETTRSNAAHNQVAHHVHAQQGTLQSVSERAWDVVVVNILAPVIVELLDGGLLDYLVQEGRLILSGIILEQSATVETAVARAGGVVTEPISMGDWISYIVRRHA